MITLKVLVVDDEPGIRSGVERILRNYTVGFPFMEENFVYEIMQAESGEMALEIINTQKMDIILLDNQLPGINGIEVLEYIRKKNYDASVMMITSYASLDLAVKATNYGAYNFLPKPFTSQELKTAIDNNTKQLYLNRMTRKMNSEGKQIRFQFLSVLSHELKSPINAIEGYLRIMQSRQVGEKLEDYSTMIDRSLKRLNGMRDLILDLLDLTKLESGDKKRILQNVDLNDIAHLAADTFKPLAIQKQIDVHIESDDTVYVYSDRKEMEIIMNNLLSNAIKYNVENGKVWVQISRESDKIRIMVEDTGIGLSKEDISKLFQDFVRIKNSKTRNVTGSGLGLSITKKMVELNGGTITVDSSPEKGSKFIVILPALNI